MATNALLRSWAERARRHLETAGHRRGKPSDRRTALRRGALSYVETLFIVTVLVTLVVHLLRTGHEYTVLLAAGMMATGWLTYRAFGWRRS